jgi:hypothetical protein
MMRAGDDGCYTHLITGRNSDTFLGLGKNNFSSQVGMKQPAFYPLALLLFALRPRSLSDPPLSRQMLYKS